MSYPIEAEYKPLLNRSGLIGTMVLLVAGAGAIVLAFISSAAALGVMIACFALRERLGRAWLAIYAGSWMVLLGGLWPLLALSN